MIQSIAGAGWTVRALDREPRPSQLDPACTSAQTKASTEGTAPDILGPAVPAGLIGKRFAATVPGCVHDALLTAGAIADPDRGDGEVAQEWVGRTPWGWHRTVDLEARARDHERIDLVFESIDTCGSVWLNGRCLGHVENQFRPWRSDVRGIARTLGNSIGVDLDGPVTTVLARARELGERPVNGDWTPYPFLRKSACSFGWDWGPKLPSCGLGPCWIDAWSTARIDQVRPLVTHCSTERATVEVMVDLEFARDGRVPDGLELEIELSLDDGRVVQERARVRAASPSITITIDRPPLWWPRGMGPQRLHQLTVRLRHGVGVLGSWTRRLGLRSVALDTAPDPDGSGSPFTLRVNGVPVFCRGANWIPVSPFPMAGSRDRARTLLEQACDANLNMLRVWGGGQYEPQWWYEACDELGLMVWQDFMFACATYPEEQPYEDAIKAEARHQVARLSAHPSVVLWCGGNEDILAWFSWGFRERLKPDQTWGRRIWLEWLPAICAELDPTRPYWAESPWSGSLEVHPNDPDRGDRHTWDLKLDAYRQQVPRFCSEFGQQSQPAVCTWRGAVGDEALQVGHDSIARRQRAWGGDDEQYGKLLPQWFTTTSDFGAWVWQGQLLQARAMRWAIEWYRANRPRCMGALFWQWNDVWTGPSWSVIDVAGRPKPAFHAVRSACAPRAVALVPRDGATQVLAMNDAAEAWSSSVTVQRVGADGRAIRMVRVPFTVQARSVATICTAEEVVGGISDAACELFTADCGEDRSVHLPQRDVLMRLPFQEPLRACVRTESGGRRETWRVTARGLLVDAWLEPLWPWERTHGNLRTLLDGESMDVTIDWTEPCPEVPVRTWVRSANEFGGHPIEARAFRS